MLTQTSSTAGECSPWNRRTQSEILIGRAVPSLFLTAPDKALGDLLVNDREQHGRVPGRRLLRGDSKKCTDNRRATDGPAQGIRCVLVDPLEEAVRARGERMGTNDE